MNQFTQRIITFKSTIIKVIDGIVVIVIVIVIIEL